MDALDMRADEMKKMISDDEELTKISDAIRFMESVATGETQLKQEKIEIKKEEEKEDELANKDKD